MCGIFAMIHKYQSVLSNLVTGLEILQNRGYDSAGIALIPQNSDSDKHFAVFKTVGSINESPIEEIAREMTTYTNMQNFSGPIGIAHTRWSTHGEKSHRNSHPHIDSIIGKIAVVHNGIIYNYLDIKNFLTSKNIRFNSETDTEVIVNLIAYHYTLCNFDMMQAINTALNSLSGTWGLVILNLDCPQNLYVCKKGSPLLVAKSDNFVIVSSEASAFHSYVNSYFALDDNEIICLNIDNPLVGKSVVSIDTSEIVSKGSYPHWMIKEICEQPKSMARAINNGARILNDDSIKLDGLCSHQNVLKTLKNLIIVGCGTSYYAGIYGSKIFKILGNFENIHVIDASEFTEYDIPKNTNSTALLVLSQSGETKDVHRAMNIAKKNNMIIIGVVNVPGSMIARESTCGVYLNAGIEKAVGSTKSFTSQCIVLSLIACWFSNNYLIPSIIKDMRNISIKCQNLIGGLIGNYEKIIDTLIEAKHVFILGKDTFYPIALEGALKLKEIGYVNAEGFTTGSLKHGPFALIETGTPVIILSETYDKHTSVAYEEVKSRGANVITISTDNNANIIIPNCGILTPVISIVVLQYIAYRIAIKKGHNPDCPKNLAKSVTVD